MIRILPSLKPTYSDAVIDDEPITIEASPTTFRRVAAAVGATLAVLLVLGAALYAGRG